MKIPEIPKHPPLKTYHLEVVSEHSIPHDVLIEHMAVALRQLKFAGFTSIALRGADTKRAEEPEVARNHPFEGPEVFDDYFAPKPPTAGTANEGSFPEDPFPLTTQVIDRLKETRRHGND